METNELFNDLLLQSIYLNHLASSNFDLEYRCLA